MLVSPPSEVTSHHPVMGSPSCTGVQAGQTRCTTTILEEPIQRVSENEKVPQSAKCLLLAHHQTGETPLGWVNRKLCAFMSTFLETPCWTKGEKFDVEGRAYADALGVDVLITSMKLERSD